MADQILTQEYLHTIFNYKDGYLYWKKTGSGILKEKSGWQDKLGYWNVGVNRKTYKIHKGISWSKKANKWMVRCMIDGKSNFLGQYENITQAVEIVRKFREENQGEFARHF